MSQNRQPLDRQTKEEIDKSLKVSSYVDDIYNAITNKTQVKTGIVPDLSPNQTASRSKGGGESMLSNEGGFLFSKEERQDHIYKTALSTLGAKGMLSIASSELNENQDEYMPSHEVVQQPELRRQNILSQNQIIALKKYPALVDLLGTDEGDNIVKDILAKVNERLVVKIASNSTEVNPTQCKGCITEKQNIKTFFVPTDEKWVCVVTANGPFRGDEAILYSPEKDNSQILRKVNDDYENVTHLFNIIHELKEKDSA